MVGIPRPEQRVDSYSFELSGGLRQRVMMALALAAEPRILIADEPTTALDVTTQAQILDLMRRLQEERGLAVILITHDMGVIAEMADDVVVMYLGREVEKGPVDAIFHAPRHPYTQSLLRSIPSVLASAPLPPRHHRGLDPASLRAAAGLPLPPPLPVLHAGRLRPRLPGHDRSRRAPRAPPASSMAAQPETPGPDSGRVSGPVAPADAERALGTTRPRGARSARSSIPIHRGLLRRLVGEVRAVDEVSFSASAAARHSRWSARAAAARPPPRAASSARVTPTAGEIRFRTEGGKRGRRRHPAAQPSCARCGARCR